MIKRMRVPFTAWRSGRNPWRILLQQTVFDLGYTGDRPSKNIKVVVEIRHKKENHAAR